MNRILAMAAFLLLSIQVANAETFLPFDGPRPIAVMLETNPWLMVIGSDTPSFVLYEDGQVIYAKTNGVYAGRYHWKALTIEELRSLKAKLASLGPYRKGLDRIELSNVSDQPETKLFLRFEGVELAASIYGDLSADPSRDERRNKTALPNELHRLSSFLSSLEFEGAKEWLPNYIEVMAWNYDYAPDASIIWPQHWPGLNSRTTIKKEHMYSIFMPGTDWVNASVFLRSRKSKGAVEIDGKKFMVSIRPVFPSEPVWRKVFFD